MTLCQVLVVATGPQECGMVVPPTRELPSHQTPEVKTYPTRNSFLMHIREALMKKKNVFFRALPELPPPPQFGQLVPLFLDVKNNVLARVTEQSKDDYDNDVSNNCDHNFGTFDDFGVKNDQKVSKHDNDVKI